MDKKTRFLAATSLIALGLAFSPATNAIEARAAEGTPADLNASVGTKQEKCYNIVKAGKNDCAAADGSHSCAGYSKYDASKQEWMLLPAGACARIVGASLEPGK